ncbi:cbb3-type cytochrome oxidase subunit 3 [Uliginosibacterium sp. H1]|uniref:cbb3-type cytochrome oxidase subunit 3 n=1 Tax=Uliginosibacterium sp. H1 TaxID=3114757 RepID=UPI002E16D883|nr:CcoQ/FixQ family Cbb3-type cytochrome c oxidase assembly chaperone [Uliginosibacterium sp. H1]
MEQNILRSLLTLLGFICFVAIAVWAYSRGAQRGFREAEMLPFDDDKAEATHSGQPHNEPRNEG